MDQLEDRDPDPGDSGKQHRSVIPRHLSLTIIAAAMAVAGLAIREAPFGGTFLPASWLVLRPLMIIVGSTGALYHGCMAVISHDAGKDRMDRVPIDQEPLEERIRQYVERIDLDPGTAVTLNDIAPLQEWQSELRAGHGPRLIESFVRRTDDLLALRYPKALPFPFERLFRVGQFEGWWTASDMVPYQTAIGYFAHAAASDRTVTTTELVAPADTTAQAAAVLRATLTVTLGIFRSVQGHPAYRTDQ